LQRYFLHISFRGDNYCGWQIQQNAPSVQQEVNKLLKWISGYDTETTGCGRTDTGVHARKFFLHFDSEQLINEPDLFLYRLNRAAPDDIAFHELFPVDAEYHARFSALSRTYHYLIHQRRNPFLVKSSWFYHPNLNIERMNEACQLLINHQDFKCFSKSNTQVNTFLCNITQAQWFQHHDELRFEITANRFLRNMVRAIVGTMIEVGRESISLQQFEQILQSGKRSMAGESVPAHALFLTDIAYPDELFKNRKHVG
jgi:tRNA pseudouridine38-40 synthase